MAQIEVHRKAYTRKDGTHVKAATYYAKDRGEPGKTPESQKWYQHGVDMNWSKDMVAETRRRHALEAHKGDELATARSLQALANVTTDSATKNRATADADYFFSRHKENK
ncbi:hypothetical protein [Dehalogenimonas etheniformans]|uniref:Uncharacterized protein n=1 Tax=Dehalogenimonas etheniformans TaxID=1536648 RepID=A0A2P5P791_9CHLR|nr:hypothetical protein [Dehalogenimonas etheniformans]PPD58161.1 hypothetical protein JP09_005055 [Dehalogenimonas etheniformans]QNT75570.1 hypothetical protein HX448_02150 [Dehalogenimonas etheniformans]